MTYEEQTPIEKAKPHITIESLNRYIDCEITLLRKRANEPNQESTIKHDFLFLADYLERMKKGINEWAKE